MEEGSFLNPVAVVHAAKIHEGMQVADLAAGSGFFTRAAAREVGESGEVWAVDPSRELLPRIKNLGIAEGLHNIEILHGNPEHADGTKLPPEHFDFVILANALFSAENKEGLVREAKRVLKKVGRALVVDWRASFGGLGPHEDHIVTEEKAQQLFEKGGFTFVENVPAGAYHWGFVVRKKKQ